MWTEIKNKLIDINSIVSMNNIPHLFQGDAVEMSVKECLDWIKNSHQEQFTNGLIPIYGHYNSYGYEEDASFLLVEPLTGKFWEIHGSHCSCYGFEGQFVPSECPIEYLAKVRSGNLRMKQCFKL
jgi:hypothetical protein